ncbi:hypothetical protein GpartN1_g3450.t1 [Galdieria partita]|uniref:Uncharacterized protein n=1 Tax=Galdieria partita TaxID=83374 RepID=A0A9C7PWU6_9RHOD|nr:hypothetical protein GpartN1_g3450.t1 [Galdieria partita]
MSRTYPTNETSIMRIPASVINPKTNCPIRTDAAVFLALTETEKREAIEEELRDPKTTVNPLTNRAIKLCGKTAQRLRAQGLLPRLREEHISHVSSQSPEPSEHSTTYRADSSHRVRSNPPPHQNGTVRTVKDIRIPPVSNGVELIDSENSSPVTVERHVAHHEVRLESSDPTSPVTPEENVHSPAVESNEARNHPGPVRRLDFDSNSSVERASLAPSSKNVSTSSEDVACGCCSLM